MYNREVKNLVTKVINTSWEYESEEINNLGAAKSKKAQKLVKNFRSKTKKNCISLINAKQ